MQQTVRANAQPTLAIRAQTGPTARATTAETRSKDQEEMLSAKQLLNAENEEAQDEADDQTTFEDADADPKVLRFRHINLCRKIENKQKQLQKQHEAVEEQKDEIARQQAKLDELQAAVEGTSGKIRELQEQSASVAMQIARIEEERKAGREAARTATTGSDCPPEALAAECLGKAAAALQGFQAQNPQVQLLLQQFITFIDQLRATENAPAAVDPKQTTLQQAFANAIAAPPPGREAPAVQPSTQLSNVSVPCFDISGSQPGDEHSDSAAQAGAEPMAVVGECVGDKRKRECLVEPESASDSSQAPVGNPTPPAAVAQQLGTPMEVPRSSVPAFVPQTREELLATLELRNKEQCQERKARTEAQHQKSCPY